MKLFVAQSEGEGCPNYVYGIFDTYEKALAAKPTDFSYPCVGRQKDYWTTYEMYIDSEGNSDIGYSEAFWVADFELNVCYPIQIIEED